MRATRLNVPLGSDFKEALSLNKTAIDKRSSPMTDALVRLYICFSHFQSVSYKTRKLIRIFCYTLCLNKSSAVAEMGDRGHNRHGPKIGEGLCPLFGGGWVPI